MRKVYIAPSFEVERYALDSSIASHCGIVVHNGPAMEGHDQCEDYKNPFVPTGDAQIMSGVYNVQFYDDTSCDCYTTGSDYGYWTS